MVSKYCLGVIGITLLLAISSPASLRAQNNIYPANGDALIHRLTIGKGTAGASHNTALGDSALYFNVIGNDNTAIGMRTLFQNSFGFQNTALGYQTLHNNTSGTNNLAAGSGALFSNLVANSCNVALGQNALYNNVSASDNNGSGTFNIGVGSYALYYNVTGYQNIAYGYYSMLYTNGGAWDNTAFGALSMTSNSTGSLNSAFGAYADVYYSNLSYATSVGYGAVATASNTVAVGNTSVTSIGGYAAWTTFSDGRFKKNIAYNVPGLAFIKKLDPLIYTLDVEGIESRLHSHRNMVGPGNAAMPGPMSSPVMQQAMQEKSRIVQTGFIAQEVEKAAESVGYSFSGIDKPKDDQQSFYGLRYAEFVVPLVKAVQELSTDNDSLKATNARLAARLSRIKLLLGIDSNAQGISDLSLPRLFLSRSDPSSQTTFIGYYVPENSGPATLQISDMKGEIIKIISLSGYGYGQINVQTAQLGAGTYTYSLFVDGRLIDTKKMLLAK